jgi:uncharacterized repeat protein (TIGR01451 family)
MRREVANEVQTSRTRWQHRAGALLSGCALAVGLFATVPAFKAHAQTATPAVAEGDSTALEGFVALLGGDKINLGQVQAAASTAPSPLNPNLSVAGALQCGGDKACATPAITSLSVIADTAKTFVPGFKGAGPSVAHTDCNPSATVLPNHFVDGVLTGANACSNIAHVEIGGKAGIVADAISVQSLTQTCAATPVGNTSVVDLFLGGNEIGPFNTNTIPANTVIPVGSPGNGIAQVILNEQIPEYYSGGKANFGHGMIVNAIHVVTFKPFNQVLSADVIIGHTHTTALCNETQVPLPKPNGVLIDKEVVGLGPGPQYSADPGTTFQYTISLANNAKCGITTVTDILPIGFTLVSAAGPLGTQSVGSAANGTQTLTWSNSTGFPTTPDPLLETITVKISPSEAPGNYLNVVDVLSECGENAGTSPPVTVPKAAAAVSALPPAAPVTAPNTGANIPAGGAVAALGLLLLPAAWVLRRRAN